MIEVHLRAMATLPYQLHHHDLSLDLSYHILSGMESEEFQQVLHLPERSSKHREHEFRSMNRVSLRQECMSNIPYSRSQNDYHFHVHDYLTLFDEIMKT